MIIKSISPRRGKRRELASAPFGGRYTVVHGPDDLSILKGIVGEYEITITREDYNTIKNWFEKYPVF